MYGRPDVNIISMSKSSQLKSRARQECPPSPLFFNIVLEVLASASSSFCSRSSATALPALALPFLLLLPSAHVLLHFLPQLLLLFDSCSSSCSSWTSSSSTSSLACTRSFTLPPPPPPVTPPNPLPPSHPPPPPPPPTLPPRHLPPSPGPLLLLPFLPYL